MRLLGLHVNTGQSAAALLKNNAVAAAAAEERFDRIKQSRAFPKKAIEFCFRQQKIGFEDLDGVAISWNPAENMRRINLSGFTQWRRYDPEWLYIVPNHLMSMTAGKAFSGEVLKMESSGPGSVPIYFVEHHLAHMAHAVAQSGFSRGLAVIVDEYGEFNSVTIAVFKGQDFKIIKRIPYPHSLGIFFAALTEYLGYQPNSEEWKVMGAAAYGNPVRFAGKLERIFSWNERQGEWVLDTRFFEHANMKRAGYLNERLVDFLGIPIRKKEEAVSKIYFDLAASAQQVFEKRLFQLLRHYGGKTREKNLALAGGCFMNALANGKILSKTPFRKIFIPYAAADNGGAMGAALYVRHFLLKKSRPLTFDQPPTPFLGPSYSDSEIAIALKKAGIKAMKISSVEAFAAEQIANQKLVGWFQGSMEFGERALGHRSILADPRTSESKERVNQAVKFREWFRPFAPSVLAERTRDYFDIPAGVSVPYMEQVYPVKPSKRRLIPAVVHQDGSARLQTVTQKSDPVFYRLLKAFESRTGIPVLLNTSFNRNGEPIVCSPEDAIRTFFTCGLDYLILGNYVVAKSDQPEA